MNTQLHDRKNLQLILSLALMAVIVTVALVAGMRSAHAQQVETGPRVLAIKLHADWCSSCRAIEPRFQEHFVAANAIPHATDPFPNLLAQVTLPDVSFNTASEGRRRRR